MIFREIVLDKMTPSIMTSLLLEKCHSSKQHFQDYIYPNGTQQNDTQQNGINQTDTKHNNTEQVTNHNIPFH